MTLEAWAVRHHVSYAAICELRQLMGAYEHAPMPDQPAEARTDEGAVQARVRLEAADLGINLYRNNVGALADERGVPVRYGLCNDTKALNKVVKSGDLIGWRSLLIMPQHLGTTIAQFVSRECKPTNWSWGEDPKREIPQAKWAEIVTAAGGDAKFCTGPGSFA